MPFLKAIYNKETYCQRLERISRINGLRHAIFSVPKDKYIGEWKDNVKEGKGHYVSRSGKLYEGDWERNYRHGFGVLAQRKENLVFDLEYRGNWKNGWPDGEGFKRYPDGSFYIGNFRRGKRHGYGQMWYADGSFYDGNWHKDLRSGLGMLIRADGNRYEGNWLKDMKHGKGRFYHLDSGQIQEGVWQEDICVFSTLIDIPFRQTAVLPTPYPIKEVELEFADEICEEVETNVLAGYAKSCESLRSSIIRASG